jgi:hypothetical protein
VYTLALSACLNLRPIIFALQVDLDEDLNLLPPATRPPGRPRGPRKRKRQSSSENSDYEPFTKKTASSEPPEVILIKESPSVQVKKKRGRPKLIKPNVDPSGSGSDSRTAISRTVKPGKPDSTRRRKGFAPGPKCVSRKRGKPKKFVSIDDLDVDPDVKSEISSREIMIGLERCDELVEKLKMTGLFGGFGRLTDAISSNGFTSGRKRKRVVDDDDDGSLSVDSDDFASHARKKLKRPAKEIFER